MWLLIILFWGSWAAIAYTYVGYPALIALLARLFTRNGHPQVSEPAGDESLPSVAMIVAAFNEEDVLRAKLANTWRIDYPQERFSILIGSDGSTDATPAILAAETHPKLRPFPFEQRRGKISVLNDLVHKTDADILIMSDASTLFEPDAVRQLVRHFQDPRVGCVTGELTIEQEGGASGEGLYLRYERLIKRAEGRFGVVIGCVGAIFAIRRSLYEPLPPSTIVEDFVLCMRVLERGFLARSEPKARAVDPASSGSRAEMKRKVRIGAGGFQALGLTGRLLLPGYGMCAFAYWGHKVLRWFVPLFLIVALTANAGLVVLPLYRVPLALQTIGLLIAAWSYNLGPGKRLPRWMRLISYFYLMNYALFCGFWRFVFRTQRVTWDRG
jgi:cellulose synthase/poly-beta-1,6-N-acetylglucosamine synthase-like glycosyltransferase